MIHLKPEQQFIDAAEIYEKYHTAELEKLHPAEIARATEHGQLRADMSSLRSAMKAGLSVSVDPFIYRLLLNA